METLHSKRDSGVCIAAEKMASSRRSNAPAVKEKNLMVLVLRNPRAQSAFSALVLFAAVALSVVRWVVILHVVLQFLLGILIGLSLVLALYFSQRIRTQSRFRRAVGNAIMVRLNSETLRRLMPSDITSHISFTDFEKASWLNKEIEDIWPFLGTAVSGLVKEELQATIDEYKTPFIEAFLIKTLWLGMKSPKFEGVKVLEGGADEVILEATFSFQSDKENIVVDMKTNGPNFTVKISDIHIAGTLKLVFKPLKEELPGFGAILVSLVEEPDMGYFLKFLGGDAKALPGVENMIDNLVKTTVEDMLVWPNRYVYPFLPGDYSYLELRPSGMLDVSLIEATDLINTDIVGKSDPFALLFVRRKTERVKRSTTKKNTLHPIWNEGFYIEVDDVEAQSLIVRMMDEEGLEQSEFMGEAKFPLKELKPYEARELWLDLTYTSKTVMPQKSRGKVHLLLIYRPYDKDKEEECEPNENAFKKLEDK